MNSLNVETALAYKEAAIAELTEAGATFPVKILLLYNPNASANNSDQEAQIVEQQLEDVLGKDYIDVVIEAGPSTSYLGYGTGIPAGVPMDQADTVLQAAIDAGYVFRADTLVELAERMGLDGEALTETVEAYNAACEAGEDAEFAKDPKYLKPITGAPYYGIVGSSWCYSTCGGLNVNEKFQVLRSEDEQPIKGLYAVGTDSMGVLFSETKAYVTYGGGAMGYAFTSGRLVGADIAEALG